MVFWYVRSSCTVGVLAALFVAIATPSFAQVDTDGDWMPDAWEVTHGFDPNDPADGVLDADSDEAFNALEYDMGTDPHDPDTDDDLMWDYWEFSWALDPLDPADAILDLDGDGLDNLDEFLAGADPTQADGDQDGLVDPDEVTAGTDPLDGDTDNDGLSDSEEPLLGLDPLARDTDIDGEIDGFQHGSIIRLSQIHPDAAYSTGDSTGGALSSDGRFAVFASEHGGLVVGDTNETMDVFWTDYQTGELRRVSVASDGTEGNDWSGQIGTSIGLDISGDGRYVTFQSAASNLVAEPNSFGSDIYLHDTVTGETSLLSRAYDGSSPTSQSYEPSMSADGRFVAFRSSATNLVAGIDANGSEADIFVRDVVLGTTERVSVDSAGVQANEASEFPGISDDGNLVSFSSVANNLVGDDTNGLPGDPLGDDAFIHNRTTGSTTRISVVSDGSEHSGGYLYRPVISGNGSVAAFISNASDLVPNDTNTRFDIFLHDLGSGTTSRVNLADDGSEANNHSDYPAISENGRYVVYQTTASNLVPGDTNGRRDIVMSDVATGEVVRLSLKNDGSQVTRDVGRWPAISADGRFVQFSNDTAYLSPDATGFNVDSYLVETGAAPDAPAVPALAPFGIAILLSILGRTGWRGVRASSHSS